jgi:hypothetical protein
MSSTVTFSRPRSTASRSAAEPIACRTASFLRSRSPLRRPGARLADDGRLTGIIDWETARVDRPRAYARARGLGVGSGPLETAFRLRHALGLLADPGDPAVVGTIEEHLAQL